MADYCARIDLYNAKYATVINEIAGKENVPVERVITAAISYAQSKIDLYCGGRYEVPFSVVTDTIKHWAVGLAIGWLHRRANKSNADSKSVHDDTIAELKDVRDGKMDLPVSSKSTSEVAYSSPFDESIFGTGVLTDE